MKLQKGIVKYKDRDDIVCLYGVTDDGKQYYFLDETDNKKFSNGNRIASTLLVEAIDPMVKASNIGLLDEDGNEVIPFVNRMIKPVNDSIILVEVATPISESVIEANKMKTDPSLATRLVSTPSLIKEKMKDKIGAEGRYLFNDQFSEVTICDIDGNNLVNGEYFSFVALNNDKLYLSRNTIDCEIQEFSLAKEIVQVDVPLGEDSNIDVSELNVESDVVEKALNPDVDTSEEVDSLGEDVPSDEVETDDVEEVQSEEQSVIPDVVTNDEEETNESEEIIDTATEKLPAEEVVESDQVQETPQEETSIEENTDSSEENIEISESDNIELEDENNEINDNDIIKNNEETVEDSAETEEVHENNNSFEELLNALNQNAEEQVDEPLPPEDDVVIETPDNHVDVGDEEEVVLDDTLETSSLDSMFNGVNTPTDFEEDLEEDSLFKNLKTDSIVDDDFSYEEDSSSDTDTVLSDIVQSMNRLIGQNKKLKSSLEETKLQVEKLNASRKTIIEKARSQEQKYEMLRAKMRSLEAKNQTLEEELQDKKRIIASQNKQLKSQVQGKEDLAKLLADAKVLLDDSDLDGESDVSLD